LDQLDQYRGDGWFLAFYDFQRATEPVGDVPSSIDVAALARRNGARHGTPFFVDPDGYADARVNRFWRAPGVRSLKLGSQRRYAFSMKIWLNFLAVMGVPWDRADATTLASFKEWRLSGTADVNVEGVSFSADLAALNRFYDWASKNLAGIANPVELRHHRSVRDDGFAQLEASPSGVRRADVKWLTPDAFRLWRDVGLRGFTAEGLPSPGWRGLNEDRNIAFAEGLYGTGLRCGEWSSMLMLEIPEQGDRALTKCQLASACAKSGIGRPFWLPRASSRAVYSYVVEGSRPAAVAHAQRSGLYERIPNILVVEEVANGPKLVVRDGEGKVSRRVVRGLSPDDRQRLFKRTEKGLEPLSLWLNNNGLPRSKRAWSKVFANANARVARELIREGEPPRLWARPHMLRHSFALRWYSIAAFVSWQRAAGLSDSEQRDFRHQLGDVWFLLASLLGHRSADTTRLIYLEPFQALQIEQLVTLMDADDRVALSRLVDVVAQGEPRVLSGPSDG
jgi:hypothetical protein